VNKAEKEEIKEALGTWLTALCSWDWFVTITLRDPVNRGNWNKPGWATAKRAWRELVEMAQPALGGLKWVRMFEIQYWRGVPHIHGLVGNVDPTVRRMDLVDWGGKKFGWTRVMPYDEKRGAAFYLCKYVTKEIADIEFSRSLDLDRRWSNGRGDNL
jgi:hypothetical protein